MPLVIKNEFRVDTHAVLDWFIDRYLPVSSGDDAKVYLYLLRIASKSTNVSSNEICKKLGISEQTMMDSLRYWENIGLICLNFTKKHRLSSITFVVPKDSSVLQAPGTSSNEQNGASACLSEEEIEKQIEGLEYDLTFNMYMSAWQQYFSYPFRFLDVKTLGYWYIKFNCAPDMIDYLVDYSANKCRGRLNMNYIEAVAQSWYQKGLLTLDAVRQFTRT